MRLLSLRTVLVATDLTPTSDPALDAAGNLAEAAGATVHVVHVAPPSADIIAREGRRSEYAQEVDTAVGRAGLPTGRHLVHVLGGAPPAAIASLADRIGADLIVLGRHREATQLRPEQPVGSTAYAVITRAAAPCLVIRRPLRLPLRRSLVAIDYSESARGALLVALSWTSALRSRTTDTGAPALTVLHVDPGSRGNDSRMRATMDQELELLRRDAGDWAGVDVQGVTQAGDHIAKAIAQFATQQQVDLVVLGTRGLSAERQSELGSISSEVTRLLDVPVLLVPPAIWRNYSQDLNDVPEQTVT
jgi:nucleotide-binding universal stress UspA family protein